MNSILNLKFFRVLEIVLFLVFFSLYIFQVNILTEEIFLVKNYERKLNELSRENELLEISLSKSNSLSNMENYFSNEKFVKAVKTKYIQILETTALAK